MDEVHDLVYFGNGGFSYGDVWNMPIMTRRYHIRKIIEFLEKKREAEEKSSKKSNTINDLLKLLICKELFRHIP